jgi:ubiquinone/menaquinone biosynthesis C-methylase UbiE
MTAPVDPPTTSLFTDEAFDQFFGPYAQNVDHFYEAAYWRLSDEVIRRLVLGHLAVRPGARILDAGGGTARWALWLHETTGADVVVADRSEAMLRVADASVRSRGGDGVALVHCDIQDAPTLEDASFQGAISIYNMLSFLDRPRDAFATLARTLEPGAVALVMGQGFANALASKHDRDRAAPEELRRLASTQIVQWAEHVPPLRVFSAVDLSALAAAAGFDVLGVYGVTCLVTPGPEDFTYPYTTMSTVSLALEDPDRFECALEQEMAFNGRPGWADRGVNLLVAARRR